MQSCQMFPRRRQLKRKVGVTVASSLSYCTLSKSKVTKYISDFTWPTKKGVLPAVVRYNTKFRDPTAISGFMRRHEPFGRHRSRTQRVAGRASLTLSCPRLSAEHTHRHSQSPDHSTVVLNIVSKSIGAAIRRRRRHRRRGGWRGGRSRRWRGGCGGWRGGCGGRRLCHLPEGGVLRGRTSERGRLGATRGRLRLAQFCLR